jgi:hypothetical protein
VRVGVLTGLAAEAKLLARCVALGDSLLVHRTGADPGRARIEAERLATAGARALISFGLAGGIDPARRPGDLIIADRVVLPGGRVVETDAEWRASLLASAPGARLGAIAGTDRMLASAADKSRCSLRRGPPPPTWRATSWRSPPSGPACRCSWCAPSATRLGRNVASVALVPLREDGTVRFGAVSRALCAKPSEWPAVLALAREETGRGFLSYVGSLPR